MVEKIDQKIVQKIVQQSNGPKVQWSSPIFFPYTGKKFVFDNIVCCQLNP